MTARREGEEEPQSRAASLVAAGVSVGLVGAIGAVLGGAVCPVCVVAAPALVGAGAYQAWRARARRPPDTQGSQGVTPPREPA